MLYKEVNIFNYTIDDGLIQLHYFQPFCRYMFQRPLSPSSALLQLSDSSIGLQMSVFNAFMYFEINFFFSSGISKLKMMFLFFWMKIFFPQIVSSKGFSDHLFGIEVSTSDCHPRGPGFDSRLYPRNFSRSIGSGTGPTQPREVNWVAS